MILLPYQDSTAHEQSSKSRANLTPLAEVDRVLFISENKEIKFGVLLIILVVNHMDIDYYIGTCRFCILINTRCSFQGCARLAVAMSII